jgi:hypothetical protein
MDPITLIVSALAAGAMIGLKDTASATVADAYAALKALAKSRLGSGQDAELILAKHEKAPETWQAPLAAELTEARAGEDEKLIAAARALLDIIGPPQSRGGKYQIDARGAIGVQIGDHNHQRSILRPPPTA